jgi:nitroimidazol reductase NimA-like FMN-containing flavoprotein (pyridoxamine 5'-phosphate oxidase superfamily)
VSEPAFQPTERSRLARQPVRGAYDEASIFAILDAAMLAHVAYAIDGQPIVLPIAFWREGRRLFWHGAAANRMIGALAQGVPACVAVSLLDGLVVAPSGFAHSINYRSVVAFGRARLIHGDDAKRRAADAFIERLYPGRAAELRPASDDELARTSFMAMDIEEASAKTREGGLKAPELDQGWPAWSGVIPVETRIGEPTPDTRVGAHALGRATPPPLAAGARLDVALAQASKQLARV